jgi:hypothetical protein
MNLTSWPFSVRLKNAFVASLLQAICRPSKRAVCRHILQFNRQEIGRNRCGPQSVFVINALERMAWRLLEVTGKTGIVSVL